jgi:hypothetical protein
VSTFENAPALTSWPKPGTGSALSREATHPSAASKTVTRLHHLCLGRQHLLTPALAAGPICEAQEECPRPARKATNMASAGEILEQGLKTLKRENAASRLQFDGRRTRRQRRNCGDCCATRQTPCSPSSVPTGAACCALPCQAWTACAIGRPRHRCTSCGCVVPCKCPRAARFSLLRHC